MKRMLAVVALAVTLAGTGAGDASAHGSRIGCTVARPCYVVVRDDDGAWVTVCKAWSRGGRYHYFEVPCTSGAHER